MVTPEGVVSRYFFGIDYPPKELKLELERSQGRPHRLADRQVAVALL